MLASIGKKYVRIGQGQTEKFEDATVTIDRKRFALLIESRTSGLENYVRSGRLYSANVALCAGSELQLGVTALD